MVWDQHELWQKAKLFADRAFQADRDGSDFPLWAILALELLARAALAHVHPALLADPQKGGNLLYAFGFGTVSAPKSVPARTVFSRCKDVIPLFADRQEKQCLALVERRNAELHSGELAFEQYGTASWLADYFATCEILADFQGRTLQELFGPDEAPAAREMIDDVAMTARDTVSSKIATAKATFEALPDDERAARLRRQAPETSGVAYKVRPCPACGGHALVLGKVVRAEEPKTEDGTLFRIVHILPTALVCEACGLMLEDHGELHAADLGGQGTVKETLDPMEHFSFYEEPDYGND